MLAQTVVAKTAYVVRSGMTGNAGSHQKNYSMTMITGILGLMKKSYLSHMTRLATEILLVAVAYVVVFGAVYKS